MSNRLIPLAIAMIERGEIGVTEAAELSGTTQTNMSHYLARRGITPRSRVDARNAWVQAQWQYNVMNILGSQATTTLDAVNRLSVAM